MRVSAINGIHYLATIKSLYEDGKFTVANSLKEFDPDKNRSVIYKDCLYIQTYSFASVMATVYENDPDTPDIISSLLKIGAIRLPYPNNPYRVISRISSVQTKINRKIRAEYGDRDNLKEILRHNRIGYYAIYLNKLGLEAS